MVPSQAEVMVDLAGQACRTPTLLEGEQHGFRKVETVQAALEAELSFCRSRVRTGDPIPALTIANLDQ